MKVLPGELGLRVGPLVLEVLAKHWFDRLRKDYRAREGSDLNPGAQLKEDDMLYRQVFVIVKVSAVQPFIMDLCWIPEI